jgi:hypothetical protein
MRGSLATITRAVYRKSGCWPSAGRRTLAGDPMAAGYGQYDLDKVAIQLNGRPRQTLNWQTPAERLEQLLVATTG